MKTLLIILAIFFSAFSFAQSIQGPNNPGMVNNDNCCGNPWMDTANILLSDDLYSNSSVSVTDVSDNLFVTGFNFSIPAGDTITGITVEIEQNGGGGKDAGVFIVKGGNMVATDHANVSNWPVTDAYTVYGGCTDLWGVAWTPADINAPDFGVAVSAKGMGAFSTLVNIDHMRITVCYNTGLSSGIEKQNFNNVLFILNNPVNDKLNLEYVLKQNKILTLTVNDIMGNVILRKEIAGIKGINHPTLNTASLPRGIYVLIAGDMKVKFIKD